MKLSNYSFKFPNTQNELIPLIIGGMGVNISTNDLALAAAKAGGIGHISDAMLPTVTDRYYKTNFTKSKFDTYKESRFNLDKTDVHFDLENVYQASKMYVEKTMQAKKGDGLIFINCMEKLTMNNVANDTLKVRLHGALEGGVDGITLSAGLHLSSFALMADHPRFREAKLGIIVSSVRALNVFLKRSAKLKRLPDFIIVEGPLAGGHLGFFDDWKEQQLDKIVDEVLAYLKEKDLTDIPVIPAGGIFTGSEGIEYIKKGCVAIQVATRFTISKECGLPDSVKQKYLIADEEDVVVDYISPTGYLMRVLKNSPGLNSGIRPNCELYGYLLEKGKCAYIDAYKSALNEAKGETKNLSVKDKVCLCTHMKTYKLWTCGHNVYRLKETTNKLADSTYQLPNAEHIINDYLNTADFKVKKPKLLPDPVKEAVWDNNYAVTL